MNKMICFDMDGTIADLYGVNNWLEKLHNEDPSPYLDAIPIWDMDKLNNILNKLIKIGYEIRIISWLAKNSSKEYKEAVRKAKLEWLKKYDFPYYKAHLIAYGVTKANCVRKYHPNAILIDDNEKVLRGWSLGETVNALEQNLIEYLENLL